MKEQGVSMYLHGGACVARVMECIDSISSTNSKNSRDSEKRTGSFKVISIPEKRGTSATEFPCMGARRALQWQPTIFWRSTRPLST